MTPTLPPRLQRYLDDLVALCRRDAGSPVSVVLFGSAARGGFSGGVSDVDAIIVLADGTPRADVASLAVAVQLLETTHGLRAPALGPRSSLAAFAERSGGNALSSFICCRSDLLSGDIARVLDLRPAEALFVDRIIFASIIASAVTVWGENLLPDVPVPPVRRSDVIKALFSFAGQLLLSVIAYPVLPDATKYAMGTLKRSLHSCFFCYQRRAAPLEEEVDFFERTLGAQPALRELLALRAQYERSFAFTVRCLPLLARLHWRTAFDNRFPLAGKSPA